MQYVVVVARRESQSYYRDSGHESRKRGESFKTRMKMNSIYGVTTTHGTIIVIDLDTI